MRFSTRTRYGLRFLLRLADLKPGELLPLAEAARMENISPGYLEQIARALKPVGVLKAQRGANGGYRLAMRPEDIYLGAIFEALEGDPYPVECLAEAHSCERAPICPTRNFWHELGCQIHAFLNSRTLADMNRNKASLLK